MAFRGVALIIVFLGFLGFAAVTSGPLVVSGWQLDPRYPVTPETTELHLLVQQFDSGVKYVAPVDPVPRVGYEAHSITISVPVRVVSQCLAQVEPTYPLVVHLAQPVGGRAILPGAGEEVLNNLVGVVCPNVSS